MLLRHVELKVVTHEGELGCGKAECVFQSWLRLLPCLVGEMPPPLALSHVLVVPEEGSLLLILGPPPLKCVVGALGHGPLFNL